MRWLLAEEKGRKEVTEVYDIARQDGKTKLSLYQITLQIFGQCGQFSVFCVNRSVCTTSSLQYYTPHSHTIVPTHSPLTHTHTLHTIVPTYTHSTKLIANIICKYILHFLLLLKVDEVSEDSPELSEVFVSEHTLLPPLIPSSLLQTTQLVRKVRGHY